jgi:hypothetical protein
MSSRTRLIVITISAPVIAFAIVGGFLGKVMAGQSTPYQHLKIFDDVVGLITSAYVEDVNVDKVMTGAMHGLVDSLDPDSAYLTADEARQVESGAALPAGGVGQGWTAHRRLPPGDQRHADPRDVGVGRQPRAARRARHEGIGHDYPRERRRSARD